MAAVPDAGSSAAGAGGVVLVVGIALDRNDDFACMNLGSGTASRSTLRGDGRGPPDGGAALVELTGRLPAAVRWWRQAPPWSGRRRSSSLAGAASPGGPV